MVNCAPTSGNATVGTAGPGAAAGRGAWSGRLQADNVKPTIAAIRKAL
jgi:hypothetical protein